VVVSVAVLSGVLWNAGHFDLDIYIDAVRGWPDHSLYDYRDPRVGLPFNYPPFAAVLFLPLTAVDRVVLDKVWLVTGIVSSACFLVMVARIAPRLPLPAQAAPLVAAVGIWSVPVLLTARLGQINWLLALLVVIDVDLERRGSRLAGVATGFAAAIKLYPAAAIVYLAARRNGRAARRAAATAVALSLLAGAIMPHELVSYWTEQVFTIDRLFGADNPLSTSIRREIAWLPLPAAASTILWLAAAALLGWIGLRRVRTAVARENPLAGITIAMCLGSAVFPLSWSHHLYFLLPAALLWFGDGSSRIRSFGAAALCIILFEGLHPGRNTIMIVARAIALVVVTVALPLDDGREGRRQPAPPTVIN
jgi:alpha-1,2-mannosyltransferase